MSRSDTSARPASSRRRSGRSSPAASARYFDVERFAAVLRFAVLRAAGLRAVLEYGVRDVRADDAIVAVLLPALRLVFDALELDFARLVDRAGDFAAVVTDARSLSRSLITVRFVRAASRRSVLSAAATSL